MQRSRLNADRTHCPACNEAYTIVESVKSLLSLHYPFYDVVVVNDGSRDATLQILIENPGYRQLSNVWRIQGWYEFLRKRKGWGKMTRTGFLKS
jgi:glycosyltransferase involved in cell wall biosynthesis